MKTIETDRGFRIVTHERYTGEPKKETRLIQESSAIEGGELAFENPGSSFLWIGQDHHLNREEVSDLIEKLQFWIDNKRLELNKTEENNYCIECIPEDRQESTEGNIFCLKCGKIIDSKNVFYECSDCTTICSKDECDESAYHHEETKLICPNCCSYNLKKIK